MPEINEPIGVSTFEVIGVNLAFILKDELENQDDPVLSAAEVEYERLRPFHAETESTFINVFYAGSRNDGKHINQQKFLSTYFIDVYVSVPTRDDEDSDPVSRNRAKRILGAIRWILSNSVYYELLLNKNLVGNVTLTDMQIADPRDNRDGNTVVWARSIVEVNHNENSTVFPPGVLEDYLTRAKVFGTDKEYSWLVDKTS